MAGLVLEGGTLRPIFSAGVMDALLEKGIMLPYVIGVSAGITDGFSYVSRQKRRNMVLLERFRSDRRYISRMNLITSRSLFGLDFAFNQIPNKLLPFDMDEFLKYDGEFWVGVTNALTGQAEYMDGKKVDREWTMVRATCAIPYAFPAIYMNGMPYYDGGVADPIPVEKALADGNEKLIVVLTQPKGFQKELSTSNKLAARAIKRRFPELSKALMARPDKYNETLKLIDRLEVEGRAMVFRPEYKLESFEKSVEQLRKNYEHGIERCKERMSEIRAFLD